MFLYFIIAGIAPLVSPLGFFIVGILADKIGRLKAIQVSYIPLVVSWTILAFANSYEIILIGRIIGGLVFGKFLFLPLLVYFMYGMDKNTNIRT